MSANVTRLRVDDESFLVASMIERCPKTMMLRELVQNALEAASAAPAGSRLVEIGGIEIDGTRKLMIRNTGPGMNADELFRMCDLAASIGKEKALDGNFGMGAKVASLTSNRLGMRYRSCAAGRVNEVVLGKRDGVYGRIRRADPLGSGVAEVLDVTGAAIAAGRSLDEGWTELVLLGNRRGQDTVADPFDGEPALQADWAADTLYHRFYRIPDGVDLVMQSFMHRQRGAQHFLPITQRLDRFERHEAVRLPDGVVIHYLFDAPDPDHAGCKLSEAGALQGGGALGALVHRGEMYDVRHGWAWSQAGARLGIAFGVQHVSVHVELPDGYPVRPDAYRQFLCSNTGPQTPLDLTDFAEKIVANRPGWLIEKIRALGPDTRIATSIRDELQLLLRGLRVRKLGRQLPSETPPAVAVAGSLVSPAKVTPVEPTSLERAAQIEAELLSDLEAAPAIVLLRDERHVHDRLLNGRAAGYDGASHELFINLRYPAFEAMRAELAGRAGTAGDADIQAIAEETMVRRLGRALIFGLAKREAAPAWDRWQMLNAISPETLTVVADDFIWALPEAERLVASRPAGHA